MLYRKLLLDQSDKEIAEACDVGLSTVSPIVRIYKAIKEDRWETIVLIAKSNTSSLETVRAIAEGQCKEVPGYVVEAFINRNKKLSERRHGTAQEEEPKTEEKAEEKPAVTGNEALYLVKLLEAAQQQNELLQQLMDAVIPHWCADLKDNVNANTDTLGQRLDKMAAAVDAIKCNTRKRGT